MLNGQSIKLLSLFDHGGLRVGFALMLSFRFRFVGFWFWFHWIWAQLQSGWFALYSTPHAALMTIF